MVNEKVLIDNNEMNSILERLTFQIIEKCPINSNCCIIGIRRRGVYLADRILANLKKHNKPAVLSGTLDITLYRDDLSEISKMPEVHSSQVDFDIAGKTVVLVDDVLFTGRTVRAAIEALLDFGRPKKIMLAVMVDRGHKEIPIQADFIGKHIPTSLQEVIHVKVKEIDNVDDCVTILKKGE